MKSISDEGRHWRAVADDPKVYCVSVPFVNVSTQDTNCFVVESDGEFLIVDTGAATQEGREVLAGALAEIGVDMDRTSFFLTHLHYDHAGLLDAVAGPSAPVYLSPVDFEGMVESRDEDYVLRMRDRWVREGVPDNLAAAFRRFGMGMDAFDATAHDLRFVGEGDAIYVGSQRFEVIGTGGHTPGHLSLFHRRSGMLFGGDHVLFVISPSLGMRLGRTDTMSSYLGNLRKLLDMPISRLMVSHGELRPDWRNRVEWLIGHHEDRAQEAYGIIAANPGISGFEATRLIRWNVPFDAWEDIPLLQRMCIVEGGAVVLDYLVEDGRVVRKCEDGVNRYAPREQ